MNKRLLPLAIALAISSAAVAVNAEAKSSFDTKVDSLVQHAVASQVISQEEAAEVVTLDLATTIQQALEKNYDVQVARAQYDAAKAVVGQAGAAKNPKFNISGQSERSGGKVKVMTPIGTQKVDLPGTPKNATGVKVGVSLPIYTGGLASGSLEMARFGEEVAAAKLLEVQENVKLKAATAYFNVLKARNMAKVADQAVDDLNRHLTTVNLQYKVGVAAKSDVLATKVVLANSQTSQIQAHNAVNLSQAALAQILTLPVNTKIEIKDKDFAYVEHDITLDSATDYALLHRPELKQAVLGEAAAKAGIKVARSGDKPMVQVTASDSWGHQSPEPAAQNPMARPTGTATNWAVGVQASWNLWDGGTTANKIKEAIAKEKSAAATKSNAITGIQLEVRQAYLNLKEAEGTIHSSQAAVEQGEENFRIASLRYSAGVGTNLDVLDAELNLNKARTNYISALYNYNVNTATLEKTMATPVNIAVGEGLQEADAKQSREEMAKLVAEEQAVK